MKDTKLIESEALEKEIDLTLVVNKTRDGSLLFQLLADRHHKLQQENAQSAHHEKKNLAECKSDFLGSGNEESDWIELTNQVCPVNVTSHSTATAEYFNELDKQWDHIRRTPTLDVTDRYSPPVVLSTILRPFLLMGAQFIFSMSPDPMLPFDLGASYPPLPPLSEEEQLKRLTRLISRLEASYKRRQSSTEGVVDLSMLQSFVKQMEENDKVIQSFEHVSYSSPIEPTTDSQKEPFSRKRNAKVAGSGSGSGGLFPVNQIRDVYRKSRKHDDWKKQETQLLEWHAAEEETVQRTFFSLPSRTKPRKVKDITHKEHDYWFAVLVDQYTVDNMDSDKRHMLLNILESWPKQPFINHRNVLEGFWNKCAESSAQWAQLLLASSTEGWQPKYPAMPKHVYAARLLSDKMLVYANSLREQVEDLITPLLQGAAGGLQKTDTGTGTQGGGDGGNSFYFCDENSPSSDWALYPGGIQQDAIFSYVLKSGTHQASAMKGAFRNRQIVSLSASLYERKGDSPAEVGSLSSSAVGGSVTSAPGGEEGGGSSPPRADGKSMRGRRRWSVGLGEKDAVENVGGTPVVGIPASFTAESIPVQSAIQWDTVKLTCDFKKLTAVLTVERKGKVKSNSLPLKECFRVNNNNAVRDSAVPTILELNLLDAESYHVVEELKTSKLQLHTALKYNRPELDILTILRMNPSCVAEKDFDGNLPLIVAIEKEESATVIGSLLALSLPMDLNGNFQEFPGGSFCWIYVLTQTNDKYVDAVVHVLNIFVKDMNHIVKISALTDEFGRKALDVATPKCRRAILSTMYFLGRYELKDGPPEHKSATCLVHIAIDRDNADMPVALKLMRWRSQYLRELQSRADCSFSGEFVLGVIRSYDGDQDSSFGEELTRKGYGWYRYGIVMPAAERNLAGVMAHEHIAGKDWKKIRQATEELCECIVHVQSKGMIHGDIKPLNIVRESGRIKLLDLDACVSFQKGDFCGAKYSSAYLPPEMVHCDLVALTAVVKSFQVDEDSGGIVEDDSADFELMVAQQSMDAWALGVTSFELCTGEPFFLNNDEDNIDEQNLFLLGIFSPKLKQDKMKKILNPQARNFVSLLLNVDPIKRLSIQRALQHPFITGRDAARLPGDQAEFDVFISYRVASDASHAAKLYELLTEKGLKVWWDHVCLGGSAVG